jgi:DNA-binding MarR family transcriptional regulator
VSAPTAVGVWLRLLAATSLIEGRVRGALRTRFATTLPRFDVLAQLDHAAREGRDGLTMGELSRRMMVTNGNLTGLVERLAREGLVRRAPSDADRRAHLVRLTPEGSAALAEMLPEHHAWIEELLAGLSDAERAALHGLLGKVKLSVEGATVAGAAAPAGDVAVGEHAVEGMIA